MTHKLVTVGLCRQQLMVVPLTTRESPSNAWKWARIPKLDVQMPG